MSAKAVTRRSMTGVRFPEDLHEQLRQAAEDRELSINFLVCLAVREFLDRLLPADEIRWTRD